MALHLEDLRRSYPAEEVKVGRGDAEHLLVATKALVKYAEELLKEGES